MNPILPPVPAPFDVAPPGRIVFGPGCASALGDLAAPIGRRPLLVTGSRPARHERLIRVLEDAGLQTRTFSVPSEPTLDLVTEGVRTARLHRADLVVAIGGGSTLDAAKAVAGLAVNPGPPTDYLEVVGRALPLSVPPLPVIALPTTAGSGSEATRNAVLTLPEHRVKVSLRSPMLLPRIALVDPELTLHLPSETTAATGMDALSQLIEPFVCRRSSPFTDALCREAIPRAFRALPIACDEGGRLDARTDLALASLFGGMALANAGLGAVHGFAAPLGGRLKAPHGAICAALLPAVMTANIEALRALPSEEAAAFLERYRQVAVWLTGDAHAVPEQGAAAAADLAARLGIPGLGLHGLDRTAFDEVVQGAKQASSMKANPVVLPDSALQRILEASL